MTIRTEFAREVELARRTTEDALWEFLERETKWATAVADCYKWGRSCNRDGNPFLAFLDLIGYFCETHGEQYRVAPEASSYSYKELGLLADALNEYADAPHEVHRWLDELFTYELA